MAEIRPQGGNEIQEFNGFNGHSCKWIHNEPGTTQRPSEVWGNTQSVLAEVTNLEKAKGSSIVNDATVYGVIRAAVARRVRVG